MALATTEDLLSKHIVVTLHLLSIRFNCPLLCILYIVDTLLCIFLGPLAKIKCTYSRLLSLSD